MAAVEDRRETASPTMQTAEASAPGAHAAELLDRLSVMDVLTSRRHSRDFSNSRSALLITRTRIVLALFALATPVWIPIDLIAFTGAEDWQIPLIRVIAALAFGTLALLPVRSSSLLGARLRLVGLLAVAGAFYITSRSVLDGSAASSAFLAGYTYLPLILIALLAIMPLTVLEGFLLATSVGLLVGGTEASLGRLTSLDTVGYLWLMGLLMSIALMAQVSQLHMLLQLYRQATRDSLTGLFNRRHLLERFEQEIARGHRYARDFSALLMDIDRFKRVNDTYGHLTGDDVLRVLAQVVQSQIRATDIVGRYGGEEFLVLLPDTGPAGAVQLAERIRVACKQQELADEKGASFGFTVSIGVTSLAPGDDGESLFSRVDEGLYQAKGAGRDRVVEVGPHGVHSPSGAPDIDIEVIADRDGDEPAASGDEPVASSDESVTSGGQLPH